MSETNSTLPDFDSFELIALPFRFGGKAYVLTEASKDVVVRYREAVFRATKPDANGRPTAYTGLAETEPLLLAGCLYHAKPDGTLPTLPDGAPDPKRLVAPEVIRSWPDRVVTPLVAKVREISELDRGASVEDIDRQVAALQKQREALAKGALADPAGNGHGATAASSA